MTIYSFVPAARGRRARIGGHDPMEVETMASITRWDPFRDLLGIQNEMTRLFDRAVGGVDETGGRTWSPAIDIYETGDAYRVIAELPGFGPDDVDVMVDDGTLTIKGERKFYSEVNEETFHRVERRYGSFQRSITLPSQVQAEKISAEFDKGILTVELPKAEAAKPRRIQIGSAGTR